MLEQIDNYCSAHPTILLIISAISVAVSMASLLIASKKLVKDATGKNPYKNLWMK